MRGRGMAIILVPDFSDHFGQSFARDVSIILLKRFSQTTKS